MSKNLYLITLLALAGGVAGGALSHTFLYPGPTSVPAKTLDAGRVRLVGLSGKASADLYAPGASGAVLTLHTENGEPRLQLGTYDGSYARSEKGLPLIGLFDNSSRLRLLFRLAGSNDSPVMVFKDSRGRDRMVMGLALSDAKEEPFIVGFDEEGRKRLLLGEY